MILIFVLLFCTTIIGSWLPIFGMQGQSISSVAEFSAIFTSDGPDRLVRSDIFERLRETVDFDEILSQLERFDRGYTDTFQREKLVLINQILTDFIVEGFCHCLLCEFILTGRINDDLEEDTSRDLPIDRIVGPLQKHGICAQEMQEKLDVLIEKLRCRQVGAQMMTKMKR